jgi:hypothetical protein
MENARKLDLRLVLGALAIVSVAVAIWAATALAGTGSASLPASEPAGGDAPVAGFVQDEGEGEGEQGGRTPDRGDCPERDGDGSGESDSGPGSGDTGSGDV